MKTHDGSVTISLVALHGPILTGRDSGARLRAEIERITSGGQDVLVDFDGVQLVAQSFADEVFARLPRDLTDTGRVLFNHVPEELGALRKLVMKLHGRPAA